jgi:predicted Zn-dependent peptidase
VVAGNINEKEVIDLVKEKFGKIKKSKHLKKEKAKNNQKSPQIGIEFKKSDQSHIIIGFRGFDLYDDRNYPLNIAATILGKGMSSRLFQKMRDELGICYYVGSRNLSNTDNGSLVSFIGAGNNRTEEAISVLIDEFKKLRDGEIKEEEIEKAKDIVLGGMATGLETSDAWAEYYGEQELFHEKILDPKQVEEKIRAVTSKDIQKVKLSCLTHPILYPL